MYHYLTGRLIEKTPTAVVLDVNGIGYQILISVSTFSALPQIGETVKILTHFVVREDVQSLFGFYSEGERDIFRLLISVSGIGPKTALAVLSGVALEDLKQAIVAGNLAVLTSIPGIGRKTAERLVVELREKIVVEDRRHASATDKIFENDALLEDSVRALVELGYKKQNAKDAIQKALKNSATKELSVPDLIRASLKYV
jgi:holliday junction DNA helicase RuvA